jgi:hypothetical protein
VYASLSSMDLVAEMDGGKVAIQTDHREADEIAADLDMSLVFGAARARNPLRTAQAGRVRVAPLQAPPPAYAAFAAQLGAELEAGIGSAPVPPARDDGAADAAVEAALERIGLGALAAHDFALDLSGLEALEEVVRERVLAAEVEDQAAFWRGVVELGAATLAVIRAGYTAHLRADTELSSMIPYRVEVHGTLLNVFGRTERFLGEDGTERPSRLLGMLADQSAPEGDVMFHLRPREWPGVGMALTLPFLSKMDNMPILAVAIDLPTSVKSIPPTQDAAEIARVAAQAQRNIERLEVSVEEVRAGPLHALVVSGSYYAAEKLFDPAFLRSQAERLGSKLLLAGVPAKGRLWLHAGLVPPETSGVFLGLMARQHDEASPQDRISGEVFLVQDGAVVGVARAPADDTAAGPPVPPPEPPPKKGFWARLFGR